MQQSLIVSDYMHNKPKQRKWSSSFRTKQVIC